MCAIFPGAPSAPHSHLDCQAAALAAAATFHCPEGTPGAEDWLQARADIGAPILPATVMRRAEAILSKEATPALRPASLVLVGG